MKKGSTELVFILDKSGSMAGLEKDTVGGFNSMLEKQRLIDGECRITTVLFSTNFELLHDSIDIRAVRAMTDREYRVGGGTALLDAIGGTIQKIGGVQKNTAAQYRAEKVMFVIITDGEENSSHEFSSGQIKKMIERQKRDYGWEFVFLGANIDSVNTASRFGISADRAVDYVPDGAGTKLNFKVMCEAVASFRASESGKLSANAFDEIRTDNKNRGARR